MSRAAFMTAGVGVVWDLRDNSRAPELGWFAGTSQRQFVAVSNDGPSFARATLDVRGYRPVPGGTLAVRGLTSADLRGSSTPFYLQASLGGPQTLRGFHNYRFTDRALAHGSVEYRWRAHRYIEIAPFLDAGTVARAWSRLPQGSLEMTPGIGLRGRTDSRVLGRLDWSRSREGQRITLGVGPAF
jgi:outer membrane protein assembly factor BamA